MVILHVLFFPFFFKFSNQNIQFCPFSKFLFNNKPKTRILSFLKFLFTSINCPPTKPETASSSSSFSPHLPVSNLRKRGEQRPTLAETNSLLVPVHCAPARAPLRGTERVGAIYCTADNKDSAEHI